MGGSLHLSPPLAEGSLLPLLDLLSIVVLPPSSPSSSDPGIGTGVASSSSFPPLLPSSLFEAMTLVAVPVALPPSTMNTLARPVDGEGEEDPGDFSDPGLSPHRNSFLLLLAVLLLSPRPPATSVPTELDSTSALVAFFELKY